MNAQEIQFYVLRYLEAEQCDILEKHPAYITVKLSPSADKALTQRPYYWSFVERTGAVPETMTCTFIFDPEAYRELHPQQGSQNVPAAPAVQPAAQPGTPQPQGDSILGRYFGFVPTVFTARVPRDELTYGSRRLEQIFSAVRGKGRFVRLFEQYAPEQPKQAATIPYETWLGVNYKVEFACDMKRSEIHSLGIQLQTGDIIERFHDRLAGKKLTPRLPAHVYVTPDRITLPRAVIYLEDYLEKKMAEYDHRWAQEAQLRLKDEMNRVRAYYEPLLQDAGQDDKAEIEARFTARLQEVEWQYRPRIQISAINCGLFHFLSMQEPNR
ncbi:YqhG family protein [Paenibacillus naphthalenovorans]|uniref:Bacterial protein YqhG n=1 Tax=Paenibacillus naphthalenovorans TaxID=162209 RepID=A0A0U2VXQ6_9BACL|nr:YqhG family protein [Paenibacillus naphthalenovorans]ALS21092.1 bacterial protein YqhG [Paenibacillus naphthalenovorans]GCL71122.1 hypothetical protein PN4B1_10270 [Paenibacillus naphthalenovorans]SDI63913.1 protein YqhG of unknown function [Paenibacillus naphthalenovorans]